MQAIWLRLDKKCLICQQRLHSMLALPPSVARTSAPCPHTSCIFRYSTAPTLGTAAAYTSWGQDARASKPLTHHRWTRRSSSEPQSRPDSSGRSGATRPRTAALSATAALKSSGTPTPLPARTNARTHTHTTPTDTRAQCQTQEGAERAGFSEMLGASACGCVQASPAPQPASSTIRLPRINPRSRARKGTPPRKEKGRRACSLRFSQVLVTTAWSTEIQRTTSRNHRTARGSSPCAPTCREICCSCACAGACACVSGTMPRTKIHSLKDTHRKKGGSENKHGHRQGQTQRQGAGTRTMTTPTATCSNCTMPQTMRSEQNVA